MILHTDGTIEGTPEEVAAYKRGIKPQHFHDANQPARVECRTSIEGSWCELTEEQVSSLSTYRLVEELSNRTGVNHIPVNEDDVLKLQIANEAKLSVNQREDLFGSKYILIERG